MIKFFKDAISEIHNVTWPSKKHIKHISTVAIVFTFSSAVFIWFTDYWFSKFVKWFLPAPNFQTQTQKPVDLKASDIKVKTVDWKDAKVEVKTESTSK